MSADQALISLLVVNIDYKLQARELYNRSKQVGAIFDPVIRIFGSSDSGQRVCAHIHGVLPYVYFRPENLHHASFESEAKTRGLITSLEEALEELLRNFKNNAYKTAAPSNKDSVYRKRKRIHSLELLRRKTIYGMYMDYFVFIKVNLYDPNDIRRVATILEEGALRGISMQSYESHIPYVLQFTSDFNIQPMGWMHIQTAKFRPPLPADPVRKLQEVDGSQLELHNSSGGAEVTSPVGNAAGVESPAFSHLKHRNKGTQSAVPVREDSVISADGGSSGKFALSPPWEPHQQLTQHQADKFLTPTNSATDAQFDGMMQSGGSSHESCSNPLCQPDFSNTSANPAASADSTTTDLLGGGMGAGTGARSRLLTQSTVPSHLIWGSAGSDQFATDAPHPPHESLGMTRQGALLPPPPAASHAHAQAQAQANLSEEEQAEVARLLQGITASDLVWSPSVQATLRVEINFPVSSSHAAGPAVAAIYHPHPPGQSQDPFNAIIGTEKVTNNGKVKESSCELELDVHVADILNKGMRRTAFGAEIWEEERLRCKLKGIEMDAAPEPPSTQTMHREPQPTEVEFRQRFANLQAKGRALRGASRNWQRRASQNNSTSNNPVLSQFLLPAGEGARMSSSGAIHPCAEESAVSSLTRAGEKETLTPEVLSQWADERLLNAQRQAELEDSVQEMFTGDSVASIAEEYFKSQCSAPAQDSPFGALADGPLAQSGVEAISRGQRGGADDDVGGGGGDGDEQELEESQEEMENIMMSTQINADNMHEKIIVAVTAATSATVTSSAHNKQQQQQQSPLLHTDMEEWGALRGLGSELLNSHSSVHRASPLLKPPSPAGLEDSDTIFSEAFYRQLQQEGRTGLAVSVEKNEKLSAATTPAVSREALPLFRTDSGSGSRSARPPLHPSRSLLSTPSTTGSALLRGPTADSSSPNQHSDEEDDLFQRWAPQNSSPTTAGENISGSPLAEGSRTLVGSSDNSPVYTQRQQGSSRANMNRSTNVSELASILAVPQSIGESYQAGSPLLHGSFFEVPASSSGIGVASQGDFSGGSRTSSDAGGSASGSGGKSISSVFRKRKRHSGSKDGPSVSFALFPEVIPASTATMAAISPGDRRNSLISPVAASTSPSAGPGPPADSRESLTGPAFKRQSAVHAASAAVDQQGLSQRALFAAAAAAAVADAKVGDSDGKAKQVRRSVSFREAEEVCPPPKYITSGAASSSSAAGEIVAVTQHQRASPQLHMREASLLIGPQPGWDDSVSTSPQQNSIESKQSVKLLRDQWISTSTKTKMVLKPTFAPPATRQLTSLETYGLLPVVNTPAHFSNPADAPPEKAPHVNYLTNLHRLKAKSDLEAFDGGFPCSQEGTRYSSSAAVKLGPLQKRVRCLIPTFLPPSPALLRQSLAQARASKTGRPSFAAPKSQIGTPTQTPYTCADSVAQQAERNKDNAMGAGAVSSKRMSRLTTMSAEVFCCTRQDFLPNPKYDAVQAVFWAVDDQIGDAESESVRRLVGIIYVLQMPLPGELYNNQAASCSGGVSAQSAPVPMTITVLAAVSSAAPTVASAPSQEAATTVAISSDIQADPTKQRLRQQQLRILNASGLPDNAFIEIVDTEVELFNLFTHRVRTMDPDFMVGYEVENKSFGYLIRRGQVLQINMLQQLSRMPNERPSYRNGALAYVKSKSLTLDEEETPPAAGNDAADKTELDSDLVITGRVVLNCWRLMREELKLFNYTYSNVAANLLSARVPYFTPAQLTRWFNAPTTRHRTVRHLHQLTVLNLQLLDKVDHVRRTAECARLYGIDYNSVLTRGSQYRVEASLMLKAHALDYLLLSPTRKQVAMQAPMQVIPLVMEPRSQFYEDPVVVLDFQSLYPSMMLAYNLCFSTIMGKMRPGCSTGSSSGAAGADADVGPETTERLGTVNYPETTSAANSIAHFNIPGGGGRNSGEPYIAPNGSVFCHKNVRLGILPQIVQEMLTTRVMVKRAMKRHKPASAGVGARDVLGKVMDARQLAIKLLSNVTYGYTSAGYSGRMPMAELADAIVQSGRSTLEWTIQTIHSHPEWGGRVVYGDTDSVFVHLRGRTREEAFRIGQEISDFITAKSPAEVVLKFEKVYMPSVLVTKKRYVGYMYETIAQKKPHFEAKGIEVVRRDQCPATVKMQEKVLRMLFETKDMSAVRTYLASEWNKMMQGGDKLLLKDFIFSKEVRFGRYASVSSQPPGAVVACKAVLQDEMAVPPYNWRVPYVVVNGTPNAPLKNLVYAPEDVLRRGSELRVNYIYYMTKCINPALDRVLSLCGGDVFHWFKSVARPKLRLRHINYDNFSSTEHHGDSAYSGVLASAGGVNNGKVKGRNKQTSMDQFTIQGSCEICAEDALPQKTLCAKCSGDQQMSLRVIMSRLHLVAEKEKALAKMCQNCSRTAQPSALHAKNEIVGPDCCESLDCQIFFERSRLVTRLEDFQAAVAEIEDIV